MAGQINKMWLLGAASIFLVALLQSTNAQIQWGESQPTNNNQGNAAQAALQQISRGSEKFALNLFRLTSETARTDLIMSPFSVWALLVLTAEGSSGNTYKELENTLGLPDDIFFTREGYRKIQSAFNVNTSTIELIVKQALFTNENTPVQPNYQDTIERIYGADLKPVDFTQYQTIDVINDYVSRATKGRFNKVVKSTDVKDANMLLISAIFFKGQWKIPFNQTFTTKENFYDEYENFNGTVNMMFQRGAFPYTPMADLDSHVLELPYGQENRLSMIILLPRRNVTLTAVIAKLPTVGMNRIFAELEKAANEYEDDEVEVHLPRFQVGSDFILNGVLENLGILDLFDMNANLNKIYANHQTYLHRVIHKAKIEVNEEGTVASSVTGGVFANKATPPRFYANRPFAFFIVEKTTKIIIFCGNVRNPSTFNF